MTEIQTVTGSTTPEALGVTLMHEHLMIGYPGWERATRFKRFSWTIRGGSSRGSRSRAEACVRACHN